MAESDRSAEVIATSTLAEARAACAEGVPAGLIVDVSLPDGSGLDLVNELSAGGQVIPTIVLTGSEDRCTWAAAAGAGASAILPKSSLGDEQLAGAIDFAFEATAGLRVDQLTASLGTRRCEGMDPRFASSLAEELACTLNLAAASLRLVDDAGRVVHEGASRHDEAEVAHVVRRKLDDWEVELTVHAGGRVWQRIDTALVKLCDALLARTRLASEQRALAVSEHRHRTIADAVRDLVITVDANDVVLTANASCRHRVGADAQGQHIAEIASRTPELLLAVQLVGAVRSSGRPVVVEDRPVDADGPRRWFSGHATPADGPDAGAVHIVLSETTSRVVTEHELSSLALTDPLTGLPNRRLAMDRLQQALDRIGRRRGGAVVAHFDVDHFKSINDVHGHATGDAVLRTIAARVESQLREVDTTARMGGDEFIVVAEGVGDHEAVRRFIERLHESVNGPLTVGNSTVEIAISIGFAVVTDRGERADDVLDRADAALYRAKRAGRNQVVEHTVVNRRLGSDAALRRELRRAHDDRRFHLRFQPILRHGRVVAAEALLRMSHPSLGELGPADFIDALLESPLLLPVGRDVASSAIEQLATLREGGLVDEDFVMHLNVAPQQLSDAGFIALILARLSAHRLPPESLAVELTEQTLLDVDRSSSALKRLAEAGVRLYLDDFGTGSSSITHLRSTALHGLKVDRSFVAEASSDTRSNGIVRGLVAMALELDLDVVLEGVEDPDQLAAIGIGPVSVQGFAYARPLLPADLAEHIRARRRCTARPGVSPGAMPPVLPDGSIDLR